MVIGLPAEALAKEGEAKDSNLPKKRRIQLKMGSVCNFKSLFGVHIRKLDW